MPILVAPVPAPGTLPEPVEMPQVSFTDPLGRVTVFTDWLNGWSLQPGPRGFDMPAYQVTTDESPDIDGEYVRSVRGQGKDLVLPLAFWSDDGRADYLARRRAFVRSLNPKLGLGTLTVVQPDGEVRTIACHYTAGMEGDEGLDASGRAWTIVTITLRAPSPFWLGAPVSVQWAAPGGGMWLPILPLAVSESQVLGSTLVTNDGDDIAYPVWTVTGPATSITLANTTTGESLLLTQTLSSTDTVVIDTRERRQTALLNGVTNLWPNLSAASAMWGLAAGDNQLQLTVAGSTSATNVRLDYQPRYLAA
jgi:hypothetical protein